MCKTLTIGVIARNGMPFLEPCLDSLPPRRAFDMEVDIILVDCCSTDQTTQTMLSFAQERPATQVYRIEGHANSAVARNVVLTRNRGTYLMLLDGDTTLSYQFLETAIAEIQTGRADCVNGALHEQRYDQNDEPEGETFFRIKVPTPELVRTSGGTILLGPAVVKSGITYDERLRRGQDRDFALQISEEYRLLRIPTSMGTHLTHHYYSSKRINDFYQQSYQRPLGIFLRKHMWFPTRLWKILKWEVGIFVGFAYYLLLFISLSTLNPYIFLSLLVGLGIDYLRFSLHGRSHEFVPIRLASPLMVIQGFLGLGEAIPQYSIKELSNSHPPRIENKVNILRSSRKEGNPSPAIEGT